MTPSTKFAATRSMRLLATLALLFVTFTWGATFTLMKEALADVPVFPFLAVRFAIAGALLFLIALLSPKTRKSFHKRTYLAGTLLGAVLFAGYALQTFALVHSSPTTAGFLTGLTVVMVPIIGLGLNRTVPSPRTWFGVVLAAIGLALFSQLNPHEFTGSDWLLLGCAVFYALQILWVDKYGREQDALSLAAIEITVLAVLCWIAAILVPNPTGTWSMQLWLRPDVVTATLTCAIPGTALAFWAQNTFQKYISAAQTAVIFTTEPIFAALVAWWLLHQGLSSLQTVGGVLMFASMLLADSSIRWPRRGIMLD